MEGDRKMEWEGKGIYDVRKKGMVKGRGREDGMGHGNKRNYQEGEKEEEEREIYGRGNIRENMRKKI